MNQTGHPTIAIVDDDPSVRQALSRLLRSADYRVQTFSCAETCLEYPLLQDIQCLLLDVRLPDLNGLDLQASLESLSHAPAVIFISGYGDIPMTVRAMRAGAVDFLTKPFHEGELLEAVSKALQIDADLRCREQQLATERARIEALTQRECEVLRGVAAGLLNKQIAAELGICEKTVKVHRAHIMEKTGVRSVAELVRICERVGVKSSPRTRTRTEPVPSARTFC